MTKFQHVDWTQRTTDIAQQLNLDISTVSKARRRYAPHTLGAYHQPPRSISAFFAPSIRTTYPATVARALAELADRRPPWPEFIRERARILGGHE